MQRANSRRLDHGALLQQLVADPARTPGRVFLPDSRNGLLDLVWQLVGLQARQAAAVAGPVAGSPGDAELTVKRCYLPARKEPTEKRRP